MCGGRFAVSFAFLHFIIELNTLGRQLNHDSVQLTPVVPAHVGTTAVGVLQHSLLHSTSLSKSLLVKSTVKMVSIILYDCNVSSLNNEEELRNLILLLGLKVAVGDVSQLCKHS